MKKMILTAVMLGFAAIGLQTAKAGSWAFAANISSGSGYVSFNGCQSQPATAYGAAPVYTYCPPPRPVCVTPSPVVVYQAPVCAAPAPVCRPPVQVASFRFGRNDYHRHNFGRW
jgi:hypothetical protein